MIAGKRLRFFEILVGKSQRPVKKEMETLTDVLQGLGAAVYQQVAEEQAKQEAQTGAPDKSKEKQKKQDKDKVVDADYEVVDDDKK